MTSYRIWAVVIFTLGVVIGSGGCDVAPPKKDDTPASGGSDGVGGTGAGGSGSGAMGGAGNGGMGGSSGGNGGAAGAGGGNGGIGGAGGGSGGVAGAGGGNGGSGGGSSGNGGMGGGGGNACVPADDMNDCTDDVCNIDGTTTHNPKAVGSSCANGGNLCNGNGLCVECLGPTDCPGNDDVCQQRTCISGTCGMDFTAIDTPLPTQSTGDCKVVVCDGMGGTTNKNDNADVPDDSNACTADGCTMGTPAHTNLPQGTDCTPSGGANPLVCNAMGQCVGCNTPANCPGIDDECSVRTCMAGVCGTSFTAANTPVAAQTANDCLVRVCDGAGNFVDIPDDADTPLDDGLACTNEACAAGAPMHPNVPDGTGCSDGEDCTIADQCILGTCVPGMLLVCQPPDQCHQPGVCNAMQGICNFAAKPNGTGCDDANGCTLVDQCAGGVCSGTPAPDGTSCMVGSASGECEAGACNLCGNGVVDPPEECDDLNSVAGDGCNACVIELTCAPGETRVVALNNTPFPIPDASQPIYSPVVINAAGGVSKVIAVVHSLTHPQTHDLELTLRSPHELLRVLSSNNGNIGDNYTYTTFDEAASTSIINVPAPFTGKFRPEESLATAAWGTDFLRLRASGNWYLMVRDVPTTNVGTLNAWSLALCVNPGSHCGDGILDPTEECDDGNLITTDECNTLCHVTDGCGDGNHDVGEECDDDNLVSGDGCSSTCQVEMTCAAGETPFTATFATASTIPDDGAFHYFPVNVPIPGAVAKASAVIGRIGHTNVAELSISLQSPFGTIRTLSANNGGSGDDYLSTFLDDDATTDINTASAPFRGFFKPEQTLSTTVGTNFRGKNAQGVWNLRIRDATPANFGVLSSWTLRLCLTNGAYCGNGIVDAGEECDDGNTNDADACSNTCTVSQGCGDGNFDVGEECDDGNVSSGDGCSSTCDIEITCSAGQTPLVVTNDTSAVINGSSVLNQYALNVVNQGAIKKAVVVVGNIPDARNDALTLDLVSPFGTKRHLSSGNGGTSIGGYLSTFFDDSSPKSITLGVHPLQAVFRPEETISAVLGTDFLNQNPQGAWQLQVKLSTATSAKIDSWSLGLCLDTVNYCGNGVQDPGEQCDDGNTNNNDTCSTACRHIGCGDGDYDVGEQCDDGNAISGDGCSSTCVLEMDCAAGQTQIIVSNTTPTTVPKGGASFTDIPVNVASAGGVKKVKVALSNIVQADTKDLSLRLQSPFGTMRNLSIANGGTGDDYKLALFEDSVVNTVGAAVAPFTGTYRPEQSLSLIRKKDFLEEAANGTWNLQARNTNVSGFNGVVYAWTLGLCVDSVAYCGNGTLESDEECDDGNTSNGDGCSSVCTIENGCADGNIDAGEQCDDDNLIAGDGCSPACQFEFTCGVGETLVTRTMFGATPIADSSTTTSSLVATGGAVKKVGVGVGQILHASTNQLALSLISPMGTTRALSTYNGGTGDNYISTLFVDGAATPPTAGAAPFTGIFKPTATLSLFKGSDFLTQNAVGSWGLRIGDNTSGTTGTLHGWTLLLCLDTAVYCGNGILDPDEECDDGNTNDADACSRTCLSNNGCGDGNFDAGEQCDDGNAKSGDGCSQTCQFEMACGPGETSVIATYAVSTAIPDNNTFINLPVNIATTGRVRKAIPIIANIVHPADADLDIQLRSPSGTVRILSDDNGGTGDNYESTFFDDAAQYFVAGETAPFRNKYRPEQSLTTTPGTDFMHQLSAGTWTLEVRDDSALNVGTFNSWSLGLCVLTSCGDGNVNAGEECDDGNTIDNDACNNGCQNAQGCANGKVDPGEACDDDNLLSGDGCSPTCQVEFTCAAGQTPILVGNDTPLSIPDTNTFVDSPMNVTTGGTIKKLIPVIGGITHPNVNDLGVYLQSPKGTLRILSETNGGAKADYRSTIFDDAATTGITAGAAPFLGVFRPEESLSTTPGTDFTDQNARGVWNLKLRDYTVGYLGTLESWRLFMCLDTVVYCGNGVVDSGEDCDDGNQVNNDACSNVCTIIDGCGDGNLDSGEWCDDDNTVSGDGCSSTCQVEINCAAGETPIIVSDNVSSAITDDNTFNNFPLSVLASGNVKKAVVAIRSIVHPNDADLDIQLVGPTGRVRNLSDDNGSTGDNYESTLFGDAHPTAITSGSAPFNGRYRSEVTLSTSPNLDFLLQNAQGVWTLQVRDDTATNTGVFNGWTLALCVDTNGLCGDGTVNPGEECDDGNTIDNDACSNICQIAMGCGSGTLEVGEQCDDGNLISGDGCSSTCQYDISCGPGEVPFMLTNNQLTPIADSLNATYSSIEVTQPGVVRKVIPSINITHAANSHLGLYLDSPYGVSRLLASDLSGANFIGTTFIDGAAIISNASAPYTGTFRPQNAISSSAGFGNQTANGTWRLRMTDDTAGTSGTLTSWTLALCIDPSVATICGNGFVEPGETCDDGNSVDFDGCSATCQIEFTCPPGQIRIMQRSNDGPLVIPASTVTGVESTIMLGDSYTVAKALVAIDTSSHRGAGHSVVTLTAPSGTAVVLNDGTTFGFDFVSTHFNEAAATPITAGEGPFRGVFNPTGNLTTIYQSSSKGAWKLKIVNSTLLSSGLLKSWTIALCGN